MNTSIGMNLRYSQIHFHLTMRRQKTMTTIKNFVHLEIINSTSVEEKYRIQEKIVLVALSEHITK